MCRSLRTSPLHLCLGTEGSCPVAQPAGLCRSSQQGWRFAAGRGLATGTGQVGCQTFPPPARGGWTLPQVVFDFFIFTGKFSEERPGNTNWQEEPGAASLSWGGERQNLCSYSEGTGTLSDTYWPCWVIGPTQISEKQKVLKTMSLGSTGKKKNIFPSCRFSVQTLMRTMCNFLAFPYVFPKRIQSGSHMNGDTDEFLPSNINKSEQFFEFETHFVRHSWTHLRFGVNIHKSSNTHASCLINALHYKTVLCFHTALFRPSFHIWDQAWRLFHPTLCKLSASALPSPKTTQPGLWLGAESILIVRPHSESTPWTHLNGEDTSLTSFLLSIFRVLLYFKLYLLQGFKSSVKWSVSQVQAEVEGQRSRTLSRQLLRLADWLGFL